MSHTHLDAAEGVDHDHAGQGPVLLDIGGDVGAIVVDMPTGLADAEIEQRPVGAEGRGPRRHPHGGVVHRHVAGATVHTASSERCMKGAMSCTYDRMAPSR